MTKNIKKETKFSNRIATEGEKEKIRNIKRNNKYIIFNKNTSDYEKVSKKISFYQEIIEKIMEKYPINIFLIEDNPGYIRLIQEAMKDSKINNNIFVAKDGQEALDFLFQKGDFKDKELPDLVLLDLNLPKISGQEVLKKIPIIILTTSKAEKDILESYECHANCYITKPTDFDKFIKIVNSIQDFWLTIVKLP